MKILKFISLIIIIFIFFTKTVFTVTNDESWKILDDASTGEVRIIMGPTYLDYIPTPKNTESDNLFPAIFILKNAVIASNNPFDIEFGLRKNSNKELLEKSFEVDINQFVPGRQFYDMKQLNLKGEHNGPSIVRSNLFWDLFHAVGMPDSCANYVKLHSHDEFAQNRFGNQNGNLYECLYIKPMNQHTILNNTLVAQASFGTAQNMNMEPHSTALKIDGQSIDNAKNLYDSTESKFNFNPSTASLTEKHTNNFHIKFSRAKLIEKSNDFAVNSPLLFINEFMASNATTIVDEFGQDDDWIEIYNGDSIAINLNGMFLTDNLNLPQKWMLPDTTLQPGDFLLIWADGELDQGPFHTNFKLSADGEQLGLFASIAMGNFPIDTLSFGIQTTDVSFGRYPDGGPNWQFFSNPTPGKSNGILTNLPPVISDVSRFPIVPTETDTVWVSALVTDDHGLKEVNLKYFETPAELFVQLMYDDGRHHDGAANDNIYSGSILPFPDKTIVHYFILAQDDSSSVIKNPFNAPDSTFSYQVGFEAPPLVINELMADNQSTITDEMGEFEDWFEIYNNSNQSIDLKDKFLTDDFSNPRKWQFPAITLEPESYLLIWADENGSQGPLHVNFRLNRNGEQIGIFESDLLGNAPIDTITYGVQQADTSYGRYPDANETWDFMPSTPGNSNVTFTKVVGLENYIPETFELEQNYPNPFNPKTRIKFSLPELARVSIKVFNIHGQLIKTLTDKNFHAGYHTVTWDGNDEVGNKVTSGTYLYQLKTEYFQATRKMVLLR